MSIDKGVDTSVLDGYFSDIADAIRGKNGSQSTYTPSQMPSAITNIPTGGDDFVVRFSWDSVHEVWTPDKTLTEVHDALIAEKGVVGTAYKSGNGVQSELIIEDENPLMLIVRFLYTWYTICPNGNIFDEYVWDSNGFNLDYRVMPIIYPNFETVAKTYTPTTSQQTETVTFDSNDYNGLQEVDITVNAMPSGTAGTPTATKGTVSSHSVSVTPSVTNVTGYITGGTKTGTAVSVSASELVSGTYTVDSSGTKDVTNYANVSVPAGTAGSPALTVDAVQNHSKTIRSSVINSTGWITGGTKSGASTIVYASDLVSGTLSVSSNGQQDVTNYQYVDVSVSGGGGGMTVATATATPVSASSSISFTGLGGEPTSFYVVSAADLATGASPYKTAAVVYDGTDVIGQTITNTNNAQVSYDDTNFSYTYNSGTLTITGSTYFQANQYKLVYTYGGSSANIGTDDVQVGSGATSITFTGLSEEPSCFSCIFKSNFATSTGYTRTIVVVYDGTNTYGMEMGSGALATSHWSYTYNSGSLTISSQSTSAGGYFHQPGYYQLTYGIGGEINIDVEPLTVTQNGVYAESGKAYSPVTVNVSGGGGSSKNVQVLQSTTRVNASSLTKALGDLTVSKTGTYDIYWSGGRSNTSSSYTWGTRLYVDGSGYGTENTSWTNNCQSNHLSNVSLTANQKLSVYARGRTGSYYTFVPMLVIIEA